MKKDVVRGRSQDMTTEGDLQSNKDSSGVCCGHLIYKEPPAQRNIPPAASLSLVTGHFPGDMACGALNICPNV